MYQWANDLAKDVTAPLEVVVNKAFIRDPEAFIFDAGNVSIVKVDLIPGHRPDAFIRINDITHCVEIKRAAFDGKALLQLRRYMEVYKLPGVAIGSEWAASKKIPNDIKWRTIPRYVLRPYHVNVTQLLRQ